MEALEIISDLYPVRMRWRTNPVKIARLALHLLSSLVNLVIGYPTVGFVPMNPAMRLPDGAVLTVPTSYDRSYSGFTPALALSWQPVEDQFAWISLSRGFDP